jgi:hypothetical protein
LKEANEILKTASTAAAITNCLPKASSLGWARTARTLLLPRRLAGRHAVWDMNPCPKDC